MKRKRVCLQCAPCTPDLIYTRDLMERGCEKYSDNSKLDSTGLKVDNLREYLTERDV